MKSSHHLFHDRANKGHGSSAGFRAETHDATSRLVCTAAVTSRSALSLSLRYVARIQTSLNLCDRSQRQNSVAATMIFTCHTRRFVAATCRGDVSQRFVASCVSAFTSQTDLHRNKPL